MSRAGGGRQEILRENGAGSAHRVEHNLVRLRLNQLYHGRGNRRAKGRRPVFDLVRPVPHGAVGQAQAADRRLAVDTQPELDRRVFLGVAPTGGKLAFQPLAKGLGGVFAQVAVLPFHLGNNAECRFPTRAGPNGVVQLEELVPVRFLCRPAANQVEINRPVGQFIRTPCEQEDVLDGPQGEQTCINGINLEDDNASSRTLDLAVQFRGNLGTGHVLQSWVDNGVAGG